MEKDGIIEPSVSEWASPMVLVRKKKDGGLRVCVDYRRLNSVSQADAYPMPRIDELIDRFCKAHYISTMGFVLWLLESSSGDSFPRQDCLCNTTRVVSCFK